MPKDRKPARQVRVWPLPSSSASGRSSIVVGTELELTGGIRGTGGSSASCSLEEKRFGLPRGTV